MTPREDAAMEQQARAAKACEAVHPGRKHLRGTDLMICARVANLIEREKANQHDAAIAALSTLTAKLAEVAAERDRLAAALSEWVEYFDKMDRDTEEADPLKRIRADIHGPRVDRSRAALAAFRTGQPPSAAGSRFEALFGPDGDEIPGEPASEEVRKIVASDDAPPSGPDEGEGREAE